MNNKPGAGEGPPKESDNEGGESKDISTKRDAVYSIADARRSQEAREREKFVSQILKLIRR
jgi:hypothetical protein